MQSDVKQEGQKGRIPTDGQETQDNQRDTSSGEAAASSFDRVLKKERSEWFARRVSLPFPQFVVEAYAFHQQETDTESGVDFDERRWKSPMYWFVWLLRGHAEMQPYLQQGKQAMTIIEGHLKNWSRSRKQDEDEPPFGFHRNDPWQEWFDVSRAEATAEFLDIWEKSRYLPGQGPLHQAVDAARRLRLVPSKEVQQRRPIGDAGDESDYGFFLSLAGHLQVIVGDQNIKLPCEKLAGLMNVSAMTISRYRKWAEQDGYITLVKAHRFRSKAKSDATEFRFDVSRWECLREKAHRDCATSFLLETGKDS